MKKVTLLGDSIRLQYGPVVVKELKINGTEVYEPEENCRFVKHTLRMLFDYRENIKGSDLIHWNCGLWDVADLFDDGPFTSLDEYLETICRISNVLRAITPNLIFATTTPVSDTYQYQKNDEIIRFNKAVVPLLQRKGVAINDLFATLYPIRDQVICEDRLHLNEKGIEICSKQVLSSIRRFEFKK